MILFDIICRVKFKIEHEIGDEIWELLKTTLCLVKIGLCKVSYMNILTFKWDSSLAYLFIIFIFTFSLCVEICLLSCSLASKPSLGHAVFNRGIHLENNHVINYSSVSQMIF
jgi:hypothetical protein